MDSQLPAGTRLGKFVLVNYIGTGATGAVYEAYEEREGGGKGARVAVKVLSAEITQDSNALSCLKNDLRIYRKLVHPCVGALHSFGRDEKLGLCFVSMDFIEGRDLGFWIESGKVDVAMAVAIFRQILSGMQAAHELELLHCDLRPRNVFVDSSLRVKIVNFGMVNLSHSDVGGRFEYLAPELRLDGLPSPLGDVYSAGMLFRKMLEGIPGGLHPDDPLHAVAIKMTEPDPRDRFRTMGEALIELDRIRGVKGGRAPGAKNSAQRKDIARRQEVQSQLEQELGGARSAFFGISPGRFFLLLLLAAGGYGVVAFKSNKELTTALSPTKLAAPKQPINIVLNTAGGQKAAAPAAPALPEDPNDDTVRIPEAMQPTETLPGAITITTDGAGVQHAHAPNTAAHPGAVPAGDISRAPAAVTESPPEFCGVNQETATIGVRAFEGYLRFSCF